MAVENWTWRCHFDDDSKQGDNRKYYWSSKNTKAYVDKSLDKNGTGFCQVVCRRESKNTAKVFHVERHVCIKLVLWYSDDVAVVCLDEFKASVITADYGNLNPEFFNGIYCLWSSFPDFNSLIIIIVKRCVRNDENRSITKMLSCYKPVYDVISLCTFAVNYSWNTPPSEAAVKASAELPS